jgi:flagellar biosynthesis/type III secretory pathway protein FliH
MDGMMHLEPEAIGFNRSGRLFGVLYAEDFDDAGTAPAPDILVEPAPPPLTQDDVDAAASAAIARARLAWQAEVEQQRQAALAAIADLLASQREQAAQEAATVAEAAVTTILSMLSGALPNLCREHGPAEARALVRKLLPSLRSEPHVTIRAHPALAPILEQDLAELDLELAGTVTVTAAPLEPGDLRIAWQNGSFKRDTGAILAAMQDALSQFGLTGPIQITPERRMAHAE